MTTANRTEFIRPGRASFRYGCLAVPRSVLPISAATSRPDPTYRPVDEWPHTGRDDDNLNAQLEHRVRVV